MYEHMRIEFAMKLAQKYGRDQVNEITAILDSVAIDYDISAKSTELAVVKDVIPPVLKSYIASKGLEGLSETSLKNYYSCLRNFFEMVEKSPEEISTNDIRMFLATYKMQRKVSDRTIDKYRQVLNAFFNWLTDEEYITKNPCRTIKDIKYEVKPRKALTRFQLERLRRMCKDDRELAIVDVLFSTGCRVSELVNMKRTDINVEKRSVHIIGKGNKHNTVYLNDNAWLSLSDYLKTRKGEDDYLFLTARAPYSKLSVRSVEHILKQYESALGCPLSPHIIRHTMATLSLKAGAKVTDIQAMLGHSSVATTQIYAETLQEDVFVAHQKYVV